MIRSVFNKPDLGVHNIFIADSQFLNSVCEILFVNFRNKIMKNNHYHFKETFLFKFLLISIFLCIFVIQICT